MRTINRLTVKEIEAAKFTGRPAKLSDGGGLYLHVLEGGKFWRLKYRHGSKEKLLSFGRHPHVTLATARRARDDAKRKLAEGVDPAEEKRAAKAARSDTFEAVAREWLAHYATSVNKKTGRTPALETLRLAQRRFETWVFPVIGSRPVRELTAPELLEMLRRIEAKGRNETALRVLQRMRQAFDYAVHEGRLDADPAATLGRRLKGIVRKHRAAITDPQEFGRLLRDIDGYRGQPTTIAALRLLPLVFTRPGELRQAVWAEFDLDAAIWRIPAERMKMRREHLVPLSQQAVQILRDLHPLTGRRPYVFESVRPGRPLSENAFVAALRTLGWGSESVCAHGFRTTASTLLHEMGWPPEIIELQLAHAQQSQVAAAYNRSQRLEERRKMLQAWADYLDALRDGGKVITLRHRSRRDTAQQPLVS